MAISKPLIVAALYLACIPGFALAYRCFCPGDFYAAAAHQEPSWIEKERGIAPVFESALQRSSIEQSEQRSILSANDIQTLLSHSSQDKQSIHLMTIDGVQVSNVRYDGTVFRFNVSFSAKTNPNTGYQNSLEKGTIFQFIFLTGQFYNAAISPAAPIYTARISTNHYEPHSGAIMIKMAATTDDQLSIENPFLRSLAPDQKMAEGRVVYLDSSETKGLQSFVDEYNGISTAIGGDFLRMLYLSGVVITTLGLGDIVPLTNLARTLVWMEAILGVILAGLFISVSTAKP